MKRILLCCTLIYLACTLGFAQLPGLHQGVLPNGLTYYILQEENFADEVNFYLFKNVGAVVEEDDQDGMAHFMEHLAFNATEHFPQGAMNFLRNNGLTFNATTGINETCFQINSVPVASKALADSSLLLLKDWSNGILFTNQCIEKEKNIVIEEWRQSRNVDRRLTEAIAPTIYNHSIYAQRNVIGNEKSIKGFTRKGLKKFFNQWYRPEVQYVAIVGDIDPIYWEAEVKRLFGDIKVSTLPVKRETVLMDDNASPLYYQFIDKENVSNSFGIYQRRHIASSQVSKREAIRENLFSKLFTRLTERRFAMLHNCGEESYIAATMTYAPIVRDYSQCAWNIVPYAGKEAEALEQVLTIRESIRREGFSEKDFEDVKWKLYEELKAVLESDKLGTPDNLMGMFKQHYLYGMPLQTFHDQLTESVEELVELEVDDFNGWIRSWMNHDRGLAFITYSTRQEDMNVSLDDFNTALAKVKSSPLLVFKETERVDHLIDFNITPGRIDSVKPISKLEAEEWVLNNGVRVLYKYLPSTDRKVYLVGSAMGGDSKVAPSDLPSYTAMKSLLMRSGIYRYDRNQLHEWCKAHRVDMSLSITELVNGIGGNAPVEEAENLFGYLYLILTRQNFAPIVFQKFVEQKKYFYATRSTSGMSAVKDSIHELLYPPTPTSPKQDTDFYNRMNRTDMVRLYNDLYGNAADFTFCFVGDLPKEEVERLVCTYLASLPSQPGKQTKHYEYKLETPIRNIVKEFEADIEGDIGEVELTYTNRVTLSTKEEKALVLLKELLQYRLFSELREKEQGVYDVSANVTYSSSSDTICTLAIHFSTERQKADRMRQRTHELVEEIRNNAFSEDDFKKVKIPLVLDENAEKTGMNEEVQEEVMMQDPMYWLAILNVYMEHQQTVQSLVKQEEEVSINSITRKDVADVMGKLLQEAGMVEITVKSLPGSSSHPHGRQTE